MVTEVKMIVIFGMVVIWERYRGGVVSFGFVG